MSGYDDKLKALGRSLTGNYPPQQGALVVGQAEDCDIRITDDPYVSSHHIRVWEDTTGVWVEDLGSTNGTTINGERVWLKQRMRPGDVLRIGRTNIPWNTETRPEPPAEG